MSQYTKKLLSGLCGLIFIFLVAFANWYWPIYFWLEDTPTYRFIWLAIFFILLDALIEMILHIGKGIELMGDSMSFSKEIHKISDTFQLVSKIQLPNNLKADYLAVGSSGVWLINVKDDGGTVSFNGEDLVQEGKVLKKYIAKSLESSYSLADFLKKELKREFIVTPVIAFSSSKINTDSVPKVVRGVYISSGKDTVSLIENTDIQLVDKNTAEEISKLFKK